jgi:hypothetical protein
MSSTFKNKKKIEGGIGHPCVGYLWKKENHAGPGQAGMAALVRQPDKGESTLFRASSMAPQKLSAI